jgi:hypothetical protein
MNQGAARSANEQNGTKAEVCEGALARVSKQERLARARQESSSPLPPAKGAGKVQSLGRTRVDQTRKSPGHKKREVGTVAAGARRQAKRDTR